MGNEYIECYTTMMMSAMEMIVLAVHCCCSPMGCRREDKQMLTRRRERVPTERERQQTDFFGGMIAGLRTEQKCPVGLFIIVPKVGNK